MGTAVGKRHRDKIPVCIANLLTEPQVAYQSTVLGIFKTGVAVLQKDPRPQRLVSIRELNSDKYQHLGDQSDNLQWMAEKLH